MGWGGQWFFSLTNFFFKGRVRFFNNFDHYYYYYYYLHIVWGLKCLWTCEFFLYFMQTQTVLKGRVFLPRIYLLFVLKWCSSSSSSSVQIFVSYVITMWILQLFSFLFFYCRKKTIFLYILMLQASNSTACFCCVSMEKIFTYCFLLQTSTVATAALLCKNNVFCPKITFVTLFFFNGAAHTPLF